LLLFPCTRLGGLSRFSRDFFYGVPLFPQIAAVRTILSTTHREYNSTTTGNLPHRAQQYHTRAVQSTHRPLPYPDPHLPLSRRCSSKRRRWRCARAWGSRRRRSCDNVRWPPMLAGLPRSCRSALGPHAFFYSYHALIHVDFTRSGMNLQVVSAPSLSSQSSSQHS
jgi:hypothetical protein